MTHMDDWLCGLAKFCMKSDLFFDDAAIQRQHEQRKKELAHAAGIKRMRQLTCKSLSTYINSIFRSVKDRHGPVYVLTCKKTFPRFNALMQECGVRCVNAT